MSSESPTRSPHVAKLSESSLCSCILLARLSLAEFRDYRSLENCFAVNKQQQQQKVNSCCDLSSRARGFALEHYIKDIIRAGIENFLFLTFLFFYVLILENNGCRSCFYCLERGDCKTTHYHPHSNDFDSFNFVQCSLILRFTLN